MKESNTKTCLGVTIGTDCDLFAIADANNDGKLTVADINGLHIENACRPMNES